MRQAIEAFASEHKLFKPHDHVIAAVSGGADSMAMLWYLYRYSPLQPEVLYLHHHLRREADEEVRFLSRFCHEHELAFHVKHLDVAAWMRQSGAGTQAAARELRYQELDRLMQERQIPLAATAHHGDDQAETLLMRFLRGTPRGEGIPVRRSLAFGTVIRPLLAVSKEDILQFLQHEKIRWCEDSSNQSDVYERNRIRMSVMPVLREENPQLHRAAQSMSEQAALDDSYLMQEAQKQLERFQFSPDSVCFSTKDWQAVPAALQSRVIPLLLNYLNPGMPWGKHHIAVFQRTASGQDASETGTIGSGIQLERSYSHVTLRRAQEAALPPRQIIEPGAVCGAGGFETHGQQGKADATLYADLAALPLIVRTRKDGDRIHTASGTKKLKKLFIDAKIPRKERDRWPIVADSHGTILWVPFLAAAVPPNDPAAPLQEINLTFVSGQGLTAIYN
ncbi:tRNA lysidine(34) synthetase TilS [Bacillus daqingensis]|uniref:tRNA(Ile)-lysidine synthase n=1 Tax=Bacillus daqingensis TaxID=872396 RepID=A0ABV9NWU8_9BACI